MSNGSAPINPLSLAALRTRWLQRIASAAAALAGSPAFVDACAQRAKEQST